ncbi:tumor necrosis factor receptor superfamily member 14 isoform X2 [Amia ocellicauda]
MYQACGPAEYTVGGECCPMCGKGLIVKRHCTADSSTTCIPCLKGTFTDQANGLNSCFQCQTCDSGLGLRILHECTTTSNTVCGASSGYYCTERAQDRGCGSAQKHTKCQPGQRTINQGTDTSDTECEDCPLGTFSTHGRDCTPWTDCALRDEEKIRDGNSTGDVVCQKRPNERRRIFIIIPPCLCLFNVLCTLLYKWKDSRPAVQKRKRPIQESMKGESSDYNIHSNSPLGV